MFKALLNNNAISMTSRANPGMSDTFNCRVIAIAQLEADYLNKTSLNLSFPRDYIETNACLRYWKNQYIGYYRFTFGDSIRNKHNDNGMASDATQRTKKKSVRYKKTIGNQHRESKAMYSYLKQGTSFIYLFFIAVIIVIVVIIRYYCYYCYYCNFLLLFVFVVVIIILFEYIVSQL